MKSEKSSSRICAGLLIAFVACIALFAPSDRVYAYTASCVYTAAGTPENLAGIANAGQALIIANRLNMDNPPPRCSRADQLEYKNALIAAEAKHQANLRGESGPEAQEIALTGLPVTGKSTTNCDSFWSFSFFRPTCWGRLLGAMVASTFVYIGVSILWISGVLFESLLNFTIVDFKVSVYDKIQGGVTIGWTVFRDIANILIIGIFTFIALSIILGLKEYGQKKLIARVLIIAVLINFSLLFTKMIIDASNFTALQFHRAALGGVVNTSRTEDIGIAGSVTNGRQATTLSQGISGQFMQAIGIVGITDVWDEIRKIQAATDNGFAGILFGIVMLIYLLGAAIVLFYGSFLLVSRAILLIFLMLTSSLAFASYLIPTWETSSYGWKTWWDSLLKTAVFAPLLMLLLWVTLLLANSLKATTGSLGKTASEPASAIAAIFGYLMILGMLFLSFKLSNIWASKISGFSMAGILPGGALGLAAMGTGFLGRNLGGWAANRGLTAMKDKAYGYKDEQGNWVEGKGANRLQNFAMNRLAGIQKGTFNPLKTAAGGGFASSVGVPKMFTDSKAGEGGFAGVMARKARKADELARAIGPTAAQQAEMRAQDTVREGAAQSGRRQTEQAAIETQRSIIAAIEDQERPGMTANARNNQPERAAAEGDLARSQNALIQLQRQQTAAENNHASELRILEARAASVPTMNRPAAEGAVQQLRAARQEAMAGEAQRIAAAQEETTQRRESVARLDSAVQETVRAELDALPQIRERMRIIQENTVAEAEERRTHQTAGDRVGRLETQRAVSLRESLLWDPRARPNIQGEMSTHNRRQALADLRAILPAASAAPAAAAAPPPAAGGGGH